MMTQTAWQSLKYRRVTLIWIVGIIATALTTVSLLQRISDGAKDGFLASARGVDLVVSQADGDAQIVLSSVFMLGAPGGGLTAGDADAVIQLPDIRAAVPLALGDTHRGFPVVSTHIGDMIGLRQDAFGKPIKLAQGGLDSAWNHVVIGAEIARLLDYQVGQNIRVAHGQGTGLDRAHPEEFEITGILAATGTPIDRAVLTTMQANLKIHEGMMAPGASGITALLIQAKRKVGIFRLQGQVENVTQGRAKAVIPGLALTQLWQVFEVVENAAYLIAMIVLAFAVVATLGLTVVQVRQRQRELFVLRAMGASPSYLVRLQCIEGTLVAVAAGVVAAILLTLVGSGIADWLATDYGIHLVMGRLSYLDGWLMLGCWLLCLGSSIVPVLKLSVGGIQQGLTENS